MQRHYLLKTQVQCSSRIFYHIMQNTYLRTRPPYGLKCKCRFLFTLLHTYMHKYKILHMKVSLYAILTMVKHEKVNSLQLYICTYYKVYAHVHRLHMHCILSYFLWYELMGDFHLSFWLYKHVVLSLCTSNWNEVLWNTFFDDSTKGFLV
jgi:hypothetical protein